MSERLLREQEVIDLIENCGLFDSGYDVMNLQKQVRELPSAEPQIIYCKDCKYMTEHYDTDGNAPYWTCSEWDSGTDYDGFCHYAERSTDERPYKQTGGD